MADDREEFEEPTLPQFPADQDFEDEDTHSQPTNPRKRSYNSHLFSFSDSSEPAIFSSDNDPAAENYAQGPRHKKQYRGTWDQQRPLETAFTTRRNDTQRKLEPVDSGVFMGSDSMDEGAELCPAAPSTLPSFMRPLRRGGDLSQAPQTSTSEALNLIDRLIARGVDDIDLTDMNLGEISNEIIQKLNGFEKFPHVEKDVAFIPTPPTRLKLFLANNQLARCPGHIFNLQDLTVLSLRCNNLTEIPPSICKLKNLTHLNLSSNKLNYLPVDLLELLHSKSSKLLSLDIHPNPFHQPQELEDSNIEDEERWPRKKYMGRDGLTIGEHSLGWRISMVARTPVQFLNGNPKDSDARNLSCYKFKISSTRQQTLEIARPKIDSEIPARADLTKVRSLAELCLITIPTRYPNRTDWAEELSRPDHAYLIEMLEDMDGKAETGERKCSACWRPVVRPALQWIEWYELKSAHHDPSRLLPLSKDFTERFVPFLKQACTWGCMTDRKRGLEAPHESLWSAERDLLRECVEQIEDQYRCQSSALGPASAFMVD